jgi:hypothetical protein
MRFMVTPWAACRAAVPQGSPGRSGDALVGPAKVELLQMMLLLLLELLLQQTEAVAAGGFHGTVVQKAGCKVVVIWDPRVRGPISPNN